MAIADANGLPIAIRACSASPHEVTLVDETLDAVLIGKLPGKLIGDKAYDSDPLDAALLEKGVEMIAPNRANRSKTQDGRPLRRYKRRWKIERLFAWIQNFRRCLTRFDYKLDNFTSFLQLACIVILLRHF